MHRGDVDIFPATSDLVVDNMTSGFDLYPQGDFAAKKLIAVKCKKRVVKAARFVEDGEIIVTGSDHGKAYVFETRTGGLLESLGHGRKDQMIQALGVRQLLIILSIH